MSRHSAARRKPTGRPPMTWLTPEALRALPVGTAVSVETFAHGPRLVGRIAALTDTHMLLTGATDDPLVGWSKVKRGRVIAAIYGPGDPVLRRGVSAADWRGGVVRTEGSDVLVEQIDGTFAWFPEADLEPAEARDAAVPATPRGPVPARVR